MREKIISLDKERTIELIKAYYKKLEFTDVDVDITPNKSYDFYDKETCLTDITITRNIKVAGVVASSKETLLPHELMYILNALFDEEGIVIEELNLDDGLKCECVGYGYAEHVEKTPYFNGIRLKVREKYVQKLVLS